MRSLITPNCEGTTIFDMMVFLQVYPHLEKNPIRKSDEALLPDFHLGN